MLRRLPEGRPIAFYQARLKLSYGNTSLTLRRFGVAIADRRGHRRRLDRQKVRSLIRRHPRLSYRELGMRFGVTHEAVRLACRELGLSKPDAQPWLACRQQRRQTLTRLADRIWRESLLLTRKQVAQLVGISPGRLSECIRDAGLVWPTRHLVRKRRLEERRELWCPSCRRWLPVAAFNSGAGRHSTLGYQCYCRACHNPRLRRKPLVALPAA